MSASASGEAVWVQVTDSALSAGVELGAQPVGLRVEVEAGDHELHGVAEATQLVDAHLEPGRRRGAGDAGDGHPVGALLAEPDRVEVGGHVGVEVGGRLDLVHQLGRHRVDGDRATGAVVLGDHAAAVGGDLGQREAQRLAVVGQGLEAGEVAATGLRPALEDVAGDHGAGQLVVRRGGPAVVGDGRPDHERGVGDPAGDHDVGALGERGGDAEAAEVGVGGERALEAEASGRRRPRRARSWRRGRGRWRPPGAGSARPAGLSPPALLTILTPRSSARPRQSSSWRTNVRA